MDWIHGKTVVITGASSGIGRSLTVQLVRKYNCKVIGIGQSEPKMRSIRDELKYERDAFSYFLFDVSDEREWENFARHINDNRIPVDILINNAGYMPIINKAIAYSDEQFQKCMDINFNAARYGVKYLLPILQDSITGGIVNVCSALSMTPMIGMSAYSASKAALKSYSESLIAELGRTMYIGYVCPGLVRTDIFRNQYFVSHSRLMKMASTDVDRMAKKIINRIVEQKERSVVGRFAKLVNFMDKFFPVLGIKFFELVIKHSKMKMFDSVNQ